MARQSKDKAGTFKPTASKRIKALHKNTGSGLSLKEFSKRLLRDGGEEGEVAINWLFNKQLNASAPLKGIGKTKKKKGGNGGGK